MIQTLLVTGIVLAGSPRSVHAAPDPVSCNLKAAEIKGAWAAHARMHPCHIDPTSQMCAI